MFSNCCGGSKTCISLDFMESLGSTYRGNGMEEAERLRCSPNHQRSTSFNCSRLSEIHSRYLYCFTNWIRVYTVGNYGPQVSFISITLLTCIVVIKTTECLVPIRK